MILMLCRHGSHRYVSDSATYSTSAQVCPHVKCTATAETWRRDPEHAFGTIRKQTVESTRSRRGSVPKLYASNHYDLRAVSSGCTQAARGRGTRNFQSVSIDRPGRAHSDNIAVAHLTLTSIRTVAFTPGVGCEGQPKFIAPFFCTSVIERFKAYF